MDPDESLPTKHYFWRYMGFYPDRHPPTAKGLHEWQFLSLASNFLFYLIVFLPLFSRFFFSSPGKSVTCMLQKIPRKMKATCNMNLVSVFTQMNTELGFHLVKGQCDNLHQLMICPWTCQSMPSSNIHSLSYTQSENTLKKSNNTYLRLLNSLGVDRYKAVNQ